MINKPTSSALIMKQMETTGLRPSWSDKPGMTSWPKKPPRPIAEMIMAMEKLLRCRMSVR
ncbi:hypothetical protein D3C85_1649500 [compost metagenome]